MRCPGHESPGYEMSWMDEISAWLTHVTSIASDWHRQQRPSNQACCPSLQLASPAQLLAKSTRSTGTEARGMPRSGAPVTLADRCATGRAAGAPKPPACDMQALHPCCVLLQALLSRQVETLACNTSSGGSLLACAAVAQSNTESEQRRLV